MNEELNSANNDARPVDPLDAAIDAAMGVSDDAPEKEQVKTEDVVDDTAGEGDNASEEGGNEDDVPGEDDATETKEENTASAPEHWPAEDKALLENIKDEEAKKLVMQIDKRLQAAHTRRSQELSEQVKVSESLKDVFKPYQEDLKQAGLNEVTAVPALINEYLATKQFISGLKQNPKEVIAGLAKQYGVSLDGLNDWDDYKEPHVVELEQKIAQLEGQIGNVANGFQQQNQQHYQNEINAFSQAKNEDGSQKHPHFERVKTAMANFMISNQGETLSTAYEKAVRADPELYQEIVAREVQQKLLEQERERIRKADLEKAKKAKRSLNSHGSSTRAPHKVNSLDDAFNAAAEKYGL